MLYLYPHLLIIVYLQVVLVGHDLGGLSVTYAMEHFHQNISASVFLAAMMLPSGFPLTLEVCIFLLT